MSDGSIVIMGIDSNGNPVPIQVDADGVVQVG